MVKEIEAKSLLIKHKRLDSWFLSAYGMNIYRGCSHNCLYCDGRAEKYQVDGVFGQDIQIKINAPKLLVKALDPRRKRTPFKPGCILVGGGVGDSYQPVEKEWELTKKILTVLQNQPFPIHMLTKSSLIERDLDLINTIHNQSHALVSMSFSTIDDGLAKRFEPGCSLPSERLQTLARFKKNGISTGMFLMPVLPFISDSSEQIHAALKAAKEVEVDYVLFGGMTLKPGRQKEYYQVAMQKHYPQLVESINNLYPDANQWGNAHSDYYAKRTFAYNKYAKKLGLHRRIPDYLYAPFLPEKERIMMMLEHLDYCQKLDGKSSPYSYAAFQISKLNQPLSEVRDLQTIKGIGPFTEKLIKEVMHHGTSSTARKLLNGV